jgi:hypothetical protein
MGWVLVTQTVRARFRPHANSPFHRGLSMGNRTLFRHHKPANRHDIGAEQTQEPVEAVTGLLKSTALIHDR